MRAARAGAAAGVLTMAAAGALPVRPGKFNFETLRTNKQHIYNVVVVTGATGRIATGRI